MSADKNSQLCKAVRHALMSSVILAPACFIAPEALAQTANVANAGKDRTVFDSDDRDGETVTLDGSGSTGAITTYTWRNGQGVIIASGRTPLVRLPEGFNLVTLTVDGGSTDTVFITVRGPDEGFAGIDDLTPNQKSTARNLDRLCQGLFELSGQGNEGQSQLTPEQDDMLSRCFGIFGGEGSTEEESVQIISQLGAEEFNAFRTLSVVFAESQFQTVMDRLVALRAGARGVSLAGLNLRIGDENVSAEQVASSLKPFFGGGASSDEPGGLLENRLGMWMRGNYGEGEKDATASDAGFDSDQWGITAGADYRFGQSAVAGVALGYGQSDLSFNSTGRGGIETTSWAASVYGSAYKGNVYLDAVVNYVGADYDTTRGVFYDEEFGDTVNQTFRGTTDGDTLSAAVSLGYDFVIGAFTLAPSVGYNYLDTSIDAFTEKQGDTTLSGFAMNLAFGDQDYKSSTGNFGVRASYALKTSWGVLVPHFRGFYVREFEDGIAAFNVRFASDPFSGATDPTPPIVVQTDSIDESYFRLTVGASAQFRNDISGYVEYQRLEGFEDVEFHDLTFGLRFQHSF